VNTNFWNVYLENYYSDKMFRQIFGRLQTLSHHTYQNTIIFDVSNNANVYFTFYGNSGPEGDKTRRNMLPDNLLEIIRIRI
jgi:hypothetical protein